jgi:hypothetical protein
MRSLFDSRRRKQRRALRAEARRRGVSVARLVEILPAKQLADLVDNAVPDLRLASWGLPPYVTLVDRPSSSVPAVNAAVSAAVVGQWQPAAELLAGSYGDWDLRACAVDTLADVAANDDGWLVAWQAIRPDDRHALVVDCAARTALARQLRRYGKTPKRFDDFRRVLADAEAATKRAMLALPEDPTPWATMVTIARGLHYDQAEFDRVWQGLLDRAPLHRRGHEAALEYWSARWHGSHERMFTFAQEAAARSPSLSVLLLQAALDMQSDTPKVWRRPDVCAALDVLLHWLDTDGANSVDVRDDLGFAAMALVKNKRGAQAVPLFQRLGSYAGGAPWRYSPIRSAQFNNYRDRACKLAGSRYSDLMTRMDGRMIRLVAKWGAKSFTEFAPYLRWMANRSSRGAHFVAVTLSHVCIEQSKTGNHEVAAAVARVSVDICRPKGEEFELWLANALHQLSSSRQQLGEPALDAAREAVEILERHLPDDSLNPVYAAALRTLARELSRHAQHDEAIDTARHAADIERQQNGPNLLSALNLLQEVVTAAGHHHDIPAIADELERRRALTSE